MELAYLITIQGLFSETAFVYFLYAYLVSFIYIFLENKAFQKSHRNIYEEFFFKNVFVTSHEVGKSPFKTSAVLMM